MPGVENAKLVDFAKSVMQCIAAHDEYILNGLVRVDVMQNNEGQLVLNELESLEARHDTLDETLSAECYSFLFQYWEKTIYECIDIFTSSR